MKKFYGIALSVILMVSMMPCLTVFADPVPVTYLDASGTTQTCTNYVSIDDAVHTESVTESGGTFTKTNVILSADTTYVVDTNNYDGWFCELKLLGDATLIFKDGKQYSVGHVDLAGHKLNVYAQKNDQNSMFDVSGYYQEKSAIENGILTINSGFSVLDPGDDTSAEATPDTISSDAKLIINNGYVQLLGGKYNESLNDGWVGAGQGIVINKCVSVLMTGGVVFDTGNHVVSHNRAFRSSDISKITLNGDYNISGYTFNYVSQNYDFTAYIQKENMASYLALYDRVTFTPKSGGGGGSGGGSGGGGGGSVEDPEESKDESANAKDNDSEIINIIEQTTITKNAVKALKNGKITVSFKAPSFGDTVTPDKISSIKYTIQRSTKKNFKKSLKKYTVKSSNDSIKFTDSKKLKKGTRYYYRVRGTVKLVDGSTVNTKWSSIKSVKCKKNRK